MTNRTVLQAGAAFVCLCLVAIGAFLLLDEPKEAVADISNSDAVLVSPPYTLPGTTYDFVVRVTNNGPPAGEDTEYIDEFQLTMPTGFTVNSATDPAASDPDITWQHTITGLQIHWEAVGHPSGWGDIVPGASADFGVNATTGSAGDYLAPYMIGGDDFGAEPHQVTGNIEIAVLAPGVHILDDNLEGGARPGYTATYEVHVLNNTGANDQFNVTFAGNSWDTSGAPNPISINNQQQGTVTVSVDVPEDAEPDVDTDTVTVTVTSVANPSYSDSILITTTAMGNELFYDDGSYEAQIGCSKGEKGPCIMANIFNPGGPGYVVAAKYMISSQGGIPQPNPLAVKVYNASPSGPTGGALASVNDTAPSFDVWREVTFTPPVSVGGWFAIGIDQTGEFVSLAIDQNGPNAGMSFVSTDDGDSWQTLNSLGPDFAGNLMIRAEIGEADDDDDTDDDTDDDDDDTIPDDDTADDDTADDDADDDTDDDTDDDDDLIGDDDDDDDDDDGCGC